MPPRDASGRFTHCAEPEHDRFWNQVVKGGSCWEWQGGTTSEGYGAFYPDSTQIGSHVWSWEQTHGAVPHGLVVDHLCGNRRCVRPDHLDLTGRGENVLRSDKTRAGINMRKTHCIRGHALEGDNLIVVPNARNPERPPWRQCRECVNAAKRDRRALQRDNR